MTTVISRASAGNVTSGESETTFYPRDQRPGPGVLFLHGSSASYASYSQATRYASSSLARYITRAGFAGCAPQLHGSQYANDVTLDDCLDAVDWMHTELGTPADEVLVVGTSMGAGIGLRLAMEYPDLVKGVVGLIPMVNINGAYAADTLGLRAAIGTAWGVTYPTSLPADADLMAQAHILGTENVPVQLWYDEADTVVTGSDVVTFGANAGASVIQINPANPGHTEAATKWCVDHATGKAKTIIDFLETASGV